MSLPEGSYTLHVRMLKDDGTMGEIEAELDIVIAKPFYRTWWAILFYVALLALAFYYRRQLLAWWVRMRHWADAKVAEWKSRKQEADSEASSDDDVEEAVLMDEENN